MAEFWEEAFKDKEEMWGFAPARSALLTAAMFAEKGIKNVLIPGIGYGRNAQPFLDSGIKVTGIEISETAIALAQKRFGSAMNIYHGSVNNMPSDSMLYDGIFSHALIHLLDEDERSKFIKNCYEQLVDDGYMVFTAISKQAPTYGEGILVSKDRYEQSGGVRIFFYDEVSIKKEFANFGLISIAEIAENHPMYLIKCSRI